MPVVATPTNSLIISEDEIRGFIRDIPGQVPGTGVVNIMFELPEFSPADIQRSIRFTVARFNIMTPISNDTAEGINPWLMLMGCTEFLLRSEAAHQLRNQATAQDGDITPIGFHDKAQLYMQMADTIKSEFEEKSKGFKISRNFESCYGSLGSGYRNVSRFFHSS